MVRVRTGLSGGGSGPGHWRLTTGARLPSQSELGDERPIPLDVVTSEIVEQPAPTTDHREQSPTGVMVLAVDLQVFRQVVDALGEERDLDLGGAGVGLVEAMLSDDGGRVGHAWAQNLLRGRAQGTRPCSEAPKGP